uniref:GNAT family N-acetyltransferase n=1 Tax=uncultured Erythrobacter sp. TaxID=263913 RepID=UPI0026308DAE|nr:GNAT family N-acetyltransferase [uncultured Erythrobacter sp.]
MIDARLNAISGPNLTLRLITPADADYVFGLRTDAAYNAHLSEVQGSAEDQRQWIETYKEREAAQQELYYVIERHDGVRCGLVRLYDIAPGSFTWGSWLLDSRKPPKAALESVVLSFDIGFHVLGATQANLDVRLGNAKAIAIYRRLEMTETARDDESLYFTYDRARFDANRPGYMAILEGKKQL